MRPTWMLVIALFSQACSADTDGDGLSNREEAEIGSNPEVVDSDADGIPDGEEVALGISPIKSDTDADGYLDGDEIREGSDPGDADSRIYAGGWRYNPEKDDWGEPTSASAKWGSDVPRFRLVDQFGDTFDIYDLAGSGQPLLLDVSGIWCGWCHELAKRIEGKPSALSSYTELDCLQSGVESGQILWVTAIYSDSSGDCGTGNAAAVDTWFTTHPQPDIPVLADEACAVDGWIAPSGYPAVVHIDTTNMTVKSAGASYIATIGKVCDAL